MKILIATANAHKVEELSALLGEEFELVSLREFPGLEMPEETGQTMRENARLKAEHCARETGWPSLADDSGIEVNVLHGAPGVFSARWADGTDADRTRALLEKLSGVELEERGAHYRCSICVSFPEGLNLEAEATCEGQIAFTETGENGFGYDSVFELTTDTGAPTEYIGMTMAQVPAEIKARVSHRARAVRKMKILLQTLN